MSTRGFRRVSGLLIIVAGLIFALGACAQDAPTPAPMPTESMATDDSEAMASDGGEAMASDGETMATDDGEAMATDDGESMATDDGESMASDDDESMASDDESMATDDGESMATGDGEAMATGDGETMAAGDGEAMATDDGESMASDDGESMASDDGESMATDSGEAMATDDGEMMGMSLPDQITAPHFVNSYPAHGDAFRQAPEAIVINFNFTLHPDSSVTVTRDGVVLGMGDVTIEDDKLTMRRPLGGGTGDGVYVIDYTACWPDGSCHEGRFGFTVDGAMAGYIDMTGKDEVVIDMKDLAFHPATIVISQGTTVTWTNSDAPTHFVNSDPHPSHNALETLNSLELTSGGSYSYTFTEAGEWAYHCSAHAAVMKGHVIVVP